MFNMDPSGETNDDRKKKRALDLHSTVIEQDCSSSSPSSTFLRKRKKLCLVGSNQSGGNNANNSVRHQCQLDYSSFWCNLLYSTLFPQAVLPVVVVQSNSEDQAAHSSTSRNREKIRNQRSVKDNRTNMVEYGRAMSNMTTTAQHCTTATLSSAQMALSALVNPQQQDYPQSGTGSIGASTTKDMNISIGGDDKPQDQLIDDGRSGGRNKPNKQIHLNPLANEQQPLSPSSGHISILSSNYTEKNKATTAAAAVEPLILPLGRTFGGISLFIR